MSVRDGLLRGRLKRPRGSFPGIAAALAVMLLTAPAAQAFWFSRKKDAKPDAKAAEKLAERRYHMRVPDKAQEGELLRFFSRKQLCLQQIGMLEQLVVEKQAELAEFNRRQERDFSMKSDEKYEYDAAARTIYRAPERRLHMRLVSDAQAALFAGLNAGKQLVLDELRVLSLLIAEKQAEIARVDEQLKSRFSIRTDRNYQYEPKTMRLYELPPAPPRPEKSTPQEMLLLAPSPVK